MGLFDSFKKKSVDEKFTKTTTKNTCISCDRAEDKFSDSGEIFKMTTPKGQLHNFIYLGHHRYGGGFVSEDWYYLCKENNKYYLLIFTDNAEFGTGWKFTELFEGDYKKLVNENEIFWLEVALSKERKTNYNIRLTTINGIQHLLPTKSSRYKFTVEDYLR